MKQFIRMAKSPINAHVTIPGSKSITNRALLMAAFADGVSEIFDVLISDDTRALIEALHNLGIVVQLDEASRSCIVGGSGGQFPKTEAEVWCRHAGTVARFMLAACASSPGAYHFDGSPQLRKRPLAGLLNILKNQGAKIEPDNQNNMPFTVLGTEGLAGGDIEVDSSETGQFLSALLMVAPFAKSSMTLKAHEIVSQPYVDMTCAMMADFGVLVHRTSPVHFSIPVPQRYHARDYSVEPDLSTASYFFAAAAVTGGEIAIQAISRKKTKQGDVEFLSILEKMGCQVMESQGGLVVRGPQELQGIEVDLRDHSDLFMTLAAMAPFAKTPTTITNIKHTRQQESDRISAMRKGLETLHVKVEEGPDWLRVYPSAPIAGVIDSHDDHRIAMAFSIIGLKVPSVVIDGAECVVKTCPDFFKIWDEICE